MTTKQVDNDQYLNHGAVSGQQNMSTTYKAHLAREADYNAQHANQAASNIATNTASAFQTRDNWGYTTTANDYTEGNKRMRDAMNAMPMGGPLTSNALGKQVDGGHYKDLKIQPIEFIHANNIPFAEGCASKYLTRWRSKGGVKDLEKAKHFIELLIELESRNG